VLNVKPYRQDSAYVCLGRFEAMDCIGGKSSAAPPAAARLGGAAVCCPSVPSAWESAWDISASSTSDAANISSAAADSSASSTSDGGGGGSGDGWVLNLSRPIFTSHSLGGIGPVTVTGLVHEKAGFRPPSCTLGAA